MTTEINNTPAEGYDNATTEDGVIPAHKVEFNPDGVAGAWEATNDDGVVPMVAAPIANAFKTDDAGNYFALSQWDGVASDRDSWFVDVEGVDGERYDILVEEKAVGVVDRDTVVPGRCRKVELRHDPDRALYVNPAQIFVDRSK